MRAMSGKQGFPVLHYDARQTVFGRPSDVLVMDLLGKSVQGQLAAGLRLKAGPATKVQRAAVLKIGRAIVECLRKLHEAGYVHNDIKPMCDEHPLRSSGIGPRGRSASPGISPILGW
jgi:hypothetical protein